VPVWDKSLYKGRIATISAANRRGRGSQKQAQASSHQAVIGKRMSALPGLVLAIAGSRPAPETESTSSTADFRIFLCRYANRSPAEDGPSPGYRPEAGPRAIRFSDCLDPPAESVASLRPGDGGRGRPELGPPRVPFRGGNLYLYRSETDAETSQFQARPQSGPIPLAVSISTRPPD